MFVENERAAGAAPSHAASELSPSKGREERSDGRDWPDNENGNENASLRRVFFQTFGCQMNEHDTRRIEDQLERRGFARTADATTADLVVVNTCSVRELAVQKALSELGRLAEKKQSRAKIAVTGCAAQMAGDALLKKYKSIDLVLGPDNIYQVGDLVERVMGGERLVRAELDETAGFQFLSSSSAQGMAAFVTVQKGCDKNCSYCIVPRVRGREVSRPLAEIVHEVEGLVASGTREVTLLGQNIDAYRDPDNVRFDALLRAVGSVAGLARLRFTTSHPNDFALAAAQAMADLPAACEHLHLPAQSGSDAVLKRMYRGYTRERYLQKVAAIRALMPNMSLTTDLIVGFPGESEDDFQQTLSLVREAQFDMAFSFTYSVRPGTPAQPWPDDVATGEKKERLARLNAEIRAVALQRTQRFVGQTLEVLVEGPSRTDASVLCGRIRQNTTVNFKADAQPGDLVQVEITEAPNGFSLLGRLSDAPVSAAA